MQISFYMKEDKIRDSVLAMLGVYVYRIKYHKKPEIMEKLVEKFVDFYNNYNVKV